ncbi:hypothetical protein ANO14919_138710 [Xylariales sp. No.14919]|nr:hypothetical protein ANO14919_138710 [Xylariales sp. No.14919]
MLYCVLLSFNTFPVPSTKAKRDLMKFLESLIWCLVAASVLYRKQIAL